MRTRCSSLLTLALFAAVLGLVSAHEHHDEPDGPYEHNFTNEEVSSSTNVIRHRALYARLTPNLSHSSQWTTCSNGISRFKCLYGDYCSQWVSCGYSLRVCVQMAAELGPTGMILGLTHSRWHVPLQTVGILLTLLPGNLLGHHHGGRSFHSTAHSHASTYLWWYLILQTACGVFLKLHLREGTRLRSSVLIAHGIIGKR